MTAHSRNVAAQTGEIETIALLLQIGFPINKVSTDFERHDCPNGYTSFLVALFHENAGEVTELLARVQIQMPWIRTPELLSTLQFGKII